MLPALGTMAFLVLIAPQLSDVAFRQTQGIVFVLAADVLSIVVAARPAGLGERFLSWSPFRFIGHVSFPL